VAQSRLLEPAGAAVGAFGMAVCVFGTGAVVGVFGTGLAVSVLVTSEVVGTFGMGAFGMAVGAFETGAVVGALRLVAKGIKTLEKHPVNSPHKESAPSETTVTFHMKVPAN
jgi:hypothetical protein